MSSYTAIHDSQGFFCTQTFNRKVMGNNKTVLLRHQPRAGLEPERSNRETGLEAAAVIGAFTTQPTLGLLLGP